MQGASIPQPPGFAKLSKTEQIHYLQTLWDLIAENPASLPVPDGHLELAEQRLDEHRRDPAEARPARDVLDRLAKSSR